MTDETPFGRWGTVIQPGEGRGFWQPLPSRGFVEVLLDPTNSPYDGFSCGTQTLPPGCHVREHGHERNHELIHIISGSGRCQIEDAEHRVGPGSTILFGRHARHLLENDGTTDMTLFWVFMPPGLEDWFSAIGRPRLPGEAMPEPFARPDDVAEVQARMRFVAPKPR
ncbi:cupin domain-containing protein [Sandaracinobacteroides saxicola]|uniref:Cupin domain-containing protein n=1 Tax=Sandaracinobacteroides saxicola TaxID=2759707 RepID=A0A7G5IKE2_9SPHN|nr:cupin domain-containing protein [Sandaracinobacteroides saxicola]QMW23834.1 cupin domain-containing protein [Sandaracinobacteroides saxicola]